VAIKNALSVQRNNMKPSPKWQTKKALNSNLAFSVPPLYPCVKVQ
jgi:hypothetical protein